MSVKGFHLKDIKYHLLAIATVVAWGVSYVSTRVLLDAGLTPTDAYVYRFIIAYVAFLAFSRFKVCLVPWRDELMLALCGFLGGTAYFEAENIAIGLTMVSDVAVLVAVNPLFTTLLAAVFLRDEHFTWKKALGSLLAFLGVGVLTFHDGFVWGDGILGDILAVAAALIWAAYTVLMKPIIVRYDALLVTRKIFFYGLIFSLPVYFCQQNAAPLSTLMQRDVLVNLLFLTLVCSILAYYVWNVVTKRLGAILVSNYLYLCPVVSVITAAIVIGERIGLMGLAGCIVILLGIILVEQRDKTND